MGILVRALESQDQGFLWQALYHAIHVPAGEAAPPREVVQRPEFACYVDGWMEHPDDIGFLAEDDGRAIGAAWLRCWPGPVHGFGFVNEATPELSMAVLPGLRGRGVGTTLLRCLLSAAQARFPAVSLSVSESNPARRLYEREGFAPVGAAQGGSITMMKRFVP